MGKNMLTIDGIVYCKRDFLKSHIESSIKNFFKEVKLDKNSVIIIVTALKEFAISKNIKKAEMLIDLDEEIKRCRGRHGSRKQKILNLLKNQYINLDDCDINKLRGCIFEKIIENYIKPSQKIFGAGIIDGKSEEEIKNMDFNEKPMIVNSCLKKTDERSAFIEQYTKEKGIGKINFEIMAEINQKLNNDKDKKNTKETCDIIFKYDKKIYLVEIKLSPIGFDCFSISTLLKMGEHLSSKEIENFELVCLSTWRNRKTENTFKLEVNECNYKCLSKKLKEQNITIEERFIVFGFQDIINKIEEITKKTA